MYEEVLNRHASQKKKYTKENHSPFMNETLRR